MPHWKTHLCTVFQTTWAAHCGKSSRLETNRKNIFVYVYTYIHIYIYIYIYIRIHIHMLIHSYIYIYISLWWHCEYVGRMTINHRVDGHYHRKNNTNSLVQQPGYQQISNVMFSIVHMYTYTMQKCFLQRGVNYSSKSFKLQQPITASAVIAQESFLSPISFPW